MCRCIIREQQWNMLDNHRRKFYVKFEVKHKLCKSIMKNKQLPLSYRYLASLHRSSLPRIASVTKQVNRCVQTGRQYNILKKVQMSRFPFRFQSYNGTLPGVRRDS
jgi:ribosomal protein S14